MQKSLAKMEEEENQKKMEIHRKREELFAMRDPKTLRKIQNNLKVIKSANKSVIKDAIYRKNTEVMRDRGPDQPDQDDYGFVPQGPSAFYDKKIQKYRKLSEEPKFATKTTAAVKNLDGTREKVKNDLYQKRTPVPLKRGCRGDNDKEPSSPHKKTEKPKVKKLISLPMDFHQILKLAEKNKSQPLGINAKKQVKDPEPARLMTKEQKVENDEQIAIRQRRQEGTEAFFRFHSLAGLGKIPKIYKPEKERDLESRTPKLSNKYPASQQNYHLKSTEKVKSISEINKEKATRKDASDELKFKRKNYDMESLEKLKAEKKRIKRDIDRLNKVRNTMEKIDTMEDKRREAKQKKKIKKRGISDD